MSYVCIINICVCAGVSVGKKHVKIKKESSNWFMPIPSAWLDTS